MKQSGQGGLFSLASQFFAHVAKAFNLLSSCLRVKVILGDGFEVMDAIRFGTLTRRESYPVLFDRIHASNVPDYMWVYIWCSWEMDL